MSSVSLDGTEQVLYTTAYQYAAAGRSIAQGVISALSGASVTITGRIRADSLLGAQIASFSATLNAAPDSVRFALAAAGGVNPVAHRLLLTIQAASATGGTVAGSMDVQPQGA